MQTTPHNTAPGSIPRGFSLAELLVGLAIISLLAAVIIPSVAGQIGRSDATRTLNDLTSVRTGVEQFVADVHRYPLKLSHLTRAVTGFKDINNVNYPTNLSNRWRGPYLGRDTTFGVGLATGYGANMLDSMTKVTYQPAIDYVTVVITGITQADFNRMDAEIDGTVSATAGLLRWVAGSGGIDTVKFLTIPIQ